MSSMRELGDVCDGTMCLDYAVIRFYAVRLSKLIELYTKTGDVFCVNVLNDAWSPLLRLSFDVSEMGPASL